MTRDRHVPTPTVERMRPPLNELDGEKYDAVIIGAGVNGASAAQHLSAAGYSVLLIDKGDFASGSSSRSSRLLHCGLRYLAPGASMWDFARHPGMLATALRMAKQAMESRAQLVTTAPERVRPMKFHFPIYRDGPYAKWQIGLAFRYPHGARAQVGAAGPSAIISVRNPIDAADTMAARARAAHRCRGFSRVPV